ncbi:MAG: hypothetical protein ABFD90_17235 [Phycisphaerales bacterium]
MNPEEMRMELERFVNAGLQAGWTGWPLKTEGCVASRFSGQWLATSAESWLGGSDGLICPVAMEGAFASLHSLC